MRDLVDYAKKIMDHRDIQKLRWTPLEKLHLTLAFLGTITEEQYQNLLNQLILGYSTLKPFYLSFSNFNWFPNPTQPRILVAEPSINNPLLTLAKLTADCCKKVGISTDSRLYRPHVALARIKSGIPSFNLETTIADQSSILVTEIYLFQSVQHIYSPLYRFNLGKSDENLGAKP